jgi:EAL domain-containing protein (putative c-di-GMP-specific phosphodiesterase class I)
MGKKAVVPVEPMLQLLGLVFASADLVFEIDRAGIVTYAIGAAERLTGLSSGQIVGSPWSAIIDPADHDLLLILIDHLKAGDRRGPVRVGLRAREGKVSRPVDISLFWLPDLGGRISCGVSLAHDNALDPRNLTPEGLLRPEGFATAVATLLGDADRYGGAVRVDMVEMLGLADSLAAMPPPQAGEVRRRVAATLRAEADQRGGATELATDRFALVRSAEGSGAGLTERLIHAVGGAIQPIVGELVLGDGSVEQGLKAMRHALDRFIAEGSTRAAEDFTACMRETVQSGNRFRAMLKSGQFALAYQPIVDLKTMTLHHFEALARFETGVSPADTIKLAEDLDLIADFDLAVVRMVAAVLARSPPETRVAVNLSAASLVQPAVIDALIAALAFDPKLRRRMLLEITETQKLTDLDAANAIFGRLRSLGHILCLDDFGAGAASLDYVRRLEVDIVKFDGRYIQDLAERPRDVLVLRHLVGLCRALGVVTIAEMIETAEVGRLVSDVGVQLGQGWFYGAATPKPIWAPPAPPSPPPGRRKGPVSAWT